jgi:hypothetical protein
MPELVLPGVYIEVRPEALIVPGPISVGNIGMVGTAADGDPGKVEVLSSYADAKRIFGSYDAFDAPLLAGHELTLVRALELAYANGASTVLAVRVAKGTPARASLELASPTGKAAKLTARPPGGFGNKVKIKVEAGAAPADPVKVTLTNGSIIRVYTGIADGNALVTAINADTAAPATAAIGDKPTEKPSVLAETSFTAGSDGADAGAAEYTAGLENLLNQNVHIMVAAGLPEPAIGAALKAHVENASTDKIKRDRIAVAGSVIPANNVTQIKPNQFSDRMIFVAPGIKVVDAAKAAAGADDPSVILSGAYAAAAVAGMISARDPHVSLTNKSINVVDLETRFTSGELEQLVVGQVLGLEERKGFRIVKAITTDSGAFQQITTRRIVDYAKFGVRSAASPYIGLLNNDRVRKAMKGSINGFLASMVDDEMLVSYELDVTASRDEEIRGIAKVTMTVRPTFSIDYIKVVMFLG